jgi:hypothetical protein
MSLCSRVKDQLKSAPCGHPYEIRALDDHLCIELELAERGLIGCLFSRVDLQARASARLRLGSSRIAEKITYLGESLGVIEKEASGGKRVLRSLPPRKDGQIISYFEILLDGPNALSLARYEYDPQVGERKAVSAPLTLETLERLVTDLLDMAGSN